MRSLIVLLCCIINSNLYSQEDRREWSPNHQLKIEDFKGTDTAIDPSVTSVMVQSGVVLEFAFEMSQIQFVFTKNFNDKVSCAFLPDTAVIKAKDSVQAERLLALAAFDFDLSELYARKIREELFRNKKAFSNTGFFQPFFDKMVAERNKISARVYTATNFGEKVDLLAEEHAAVKKEIDTYTHFCKECKPPRNRGN